MSQEKEKKVVIQDEREPKEERKTGAPTPFSEVTAAQPAGGFIIRDEVEMLRAGFKNKHGEPVKTQARVMDVEL